MNIIGQQAVEPDGACWRHCRAKIAVEVIVCVGEEHGFASVSRLSEVVAMRARHIPSKKSATLQNN
jgi:hypothetical protein